MLDFIYKVLRFRKGLDFKVDVLGRFLVLDIWVNEIRWYMVFK